MSSLTDKLASTITRLSPFGKRDDDPLSSFRTVARWVDNLPVGDAFRCQQTILDELTESARLKIKQNQLVI